MKIIGVTGGIGSGKSTVSNILEKSGGLIIDADKINHNIMRRGKPAYNEIIDYFSKGILLDDQEIDRKQLGAIVFDKNNINNEKLDKLVSITHKYVIKETMDYIDYYTKNPSGYKFLVIDAPLLVEAELHKICDELFVLYTDIDIRLNRIIKRDGITKDEALKRINKQMSFDELKKYATFVIVNNESSRALEIQILAILGKIFKE